MFSDKSLYFKQKQQIFDCMGAIAELSWLRLNEFWNHIQAIFTLFFGLTKNECVIKTRIAF